MNSYISYRNWSTGYRHSTPAPGTTRKETGIVYQLQRTVSSATRTGPQARTIRKATGTAPPAAESAPPSVTGKAPQATGTAPPSKGRAPPTTGRAHQRHVQFYKLQDNSPSYLDCSTRTALPDIGAAQPATGIAPPEQEQLCQIKGQLSQLQG